jgi:hypothetical protein
MTHESELGYPDDLRELLADHPGEDIYPTADFRVEWGPIFHRGRLDGTARVLILGQDPAAHEAIVRRILVGEAGQRVQGLLAKLGIDRSYVMVNTFLYSVFGQAGGDRHRDDPAIAAYRHRWLDHLVDGSPIEVVIALGGLADSAYGQWRDTRAGRAVPRGYAHITHPTYPESIARGGSVTREEATASMLSNWNEHVAPLAPVVTPDAPRAWVPYGDAFTEGDLVAIPEIDLPPGFPSWMRSLDSWAVRQPIREATGEHATSDELDEARRAGIGVRVPRNQRIWHTTP